MSTAETTITAAPAAPAAPAPAAPAPVNPITEVGASATELSQTVTRTIDPSGTYRVALHQIKIDVYPNYRKSVTEAYLKTLVIALGNNRDGQQISSINGAWVDGYYIALIAGFCRVEAMQRNALKKVVDAYNESFGFSNGDVGFIPLGGKGFDSYYDRLKIRDAGPEWAEKYDKALKDYPVNIITAPVANKLEAMCRNFGENNIREDTCLFDNMVRIQEFVDSGMKGNDIAKLAKANVSAVSQYTKIWEFVRDFPKMIEMNTKPGTVERQHAINAFNEFVRRSKLMKDSDEKVPFSHARDYTGIVLHSKAPLSWPRSIDLLKKLVCLNDKGEPTKGETMDYGAFQTRCKDAQRLDQLPAVDPNAVAPATGVIPSLTLPTGVDPSATPHTAESLAAQQAAGVVTNVVSPATGNPVVPVQPTVPNKTAEVVRPEDAAREAAIGNANLTKADAVQIAAPTSADLAPPASHDKDAPIEDLTAFDAGDDYMQSLVGTGVDASDLAPILPTGERKGSTMLSSSPTERYAMSSPEKLETKALRLVSVALDKETDLVDRACQMFSAINLFAAIGRSGEMDACHTSYVEYVEKVIAYVDALKATADKSASDADKAMLASLLPEITPPVFPTSEA